MFCTINQHCIFHLQHAASIACFSHVFFKHALSLTQSSNCDLQTDDSKGRFCAAEQILESEAYPDLLKLATHINASLGLICDTKQVDIDVFHRLNTTKVVPTQLRCYVWHQLQWGPFSNAMSKPISKGQARQWRHCSSSPQLMLTVEMLTQCASCHKEPYLSVAPPSVRSASQQHGWMQVKAWLCCKVEHLKGGLKQSGLGQAFQHMDDVQLAAYCIAMLAEYVQEHWLAELRNIYQVPNSGMLLAAIS